MAYSEKTIITNQLGKLFYLIELAGLNYIFKICFEIKGGDFNIDCLKKACAFELERYPIFKSTVAEKRGILKWDLLWILKEDYNLDDNIGLYDFSSLSSEEADKEYLSIIHDDFSWFSLSRNTPFFIRFFKFSDDKMRLVFFFHHAACDGVGCGLFLNDLFESYNNFYSNKKPCHKSEPVFSSQLIPGTFSERVVTLLRGIKLLWKQDSFKKSDGVSKTSFSSKVCSVERQIDIATMEKYLSALKKIGTTFTVFFTAAYIRAFIKYKGSYEPDSLRVMFHKNLRKTDRNLREVQNRFSVFYVNIRNNDLRSIKSLVESIKTQSAFAQENNDSEKVLSLLWFIDLIPARIFYRSWLRVLFNRNAIQNILSISSMGRVLFDFSDDTFLNRLGSSEIKSCFIKSHPILSIGDYLGFCTYKNILFVNYDYFTDFINEEDAEKLGDFIQQSLDDTADEILKL